MIWLPRTPEERHDWMLSMAGCGFSAGIGTFIGFMLNGGALAIGIGLVLAALFVFEAIRVAEARARKADLDADQAINHEFQRMLDRWVERDIEAARRKPIVNDNEGEEGEQLPWQRTH